jgi:hypothetical protein
MRIGRTAHILKKLSNKAALTSERYSIDKKMLQRSFVNAAAKVKK